MNCAACGGVVRTTSLAYVAKPDGSCARGRVCRRCVARALVVVPFVTQVTKGVAPVEADRRAAKEAVAAATKKLRGMLRAYAAHTTRADEGMKAGLNVAIEVLEAGDF